MDIYQMDAESSYLNGTLKKTAYMQQSEMFDDGCNKVSLLKKKVNLWS